MQAIEEYFPVVLFIMLYKVVLTFESVDEILKCDHSNESYWTVLSSGAGYSAKTGGSNLRVRMKCLGGTIKMKATEQYVPVVLFIMLHKMGLTFESVDEILKCDHSNESYLAVLSCGAVYYAVQGGSNFWVCGWNA